MNPEWHKQHKMPDKATEKERIEWHLEHARNRACRPVPEDLLAKMEKRGAPRRASASGEHE
jgi:hypothetical protein